MSNKLTQSQIKAYNDNGGTKCPGCGSPNIESEHAQLDGRFGYARVVCNACGATWQDEWKFTGLVADTFEAGEETTELEKTEAKQ